MIEFVADETWIQLRRMLSRADARRAAIAYVGKDAPTILRLRQGDSIIVDGSDRALRAGATSPATVEVWLKAGVQVHSLVGLHAKVLLIDAKPRIAMIGSPNASGYSRDDLREAAVITDDETTIGDVEDQLDEWTALADPLDPAWVRRAEGLYRAPFAGHRPRKTQSLPPLGDRRLWLFDFVTHDRPISPAVQRATLAAAKDPNVSIGILDLSPGWKPEVGDIFVMVRARPNADLPDGRSVVFPPARVIRITRPSRSYPATAILGRDPTAKSIRYARIRSAISEADKLLDSNSPVSGGETRRAILRLFE